jgi:hypothetical protein
VGARLLSAPRSASSRVRTRSRRCRRTEGRARARTRYCLLALSSSASTSSSLPVFGFAGRTRSKRKSGVGGCRNSSIRIAASHEALLVRRRREGRFVWWRVWLRDRRRRGQCCFIGGWSWLRGQVRCLRVRHTACLTAAAVAQTRFLRRSGILGSRLVGHPRAGNWTGEWDRALEVRTARGCRSLRAVVAVSRASWRVPALVTCYAERNLLA